MNSKEKKKELDLLIWQTQRAPCSVSEWGGKQKQWEKLGKQSLRIESASPSDIMEIGGNFNGNLDQTSRHFFMISHEICCCLCQWTEFSSGRLCRLLQWLLEFNDLKCLSLSSAENGITGLLPTNWLYKHISAESIWPDDTFSQKDIKSYSCGARWQPLWSEVLVHIGHKAGWGFAIFLGKSCPETEVDRCPGLSESFYRVQMLVYTEISQPVLIREQYYVPQINSASPLSDC